MAASLAASLAVDPHHHPRHFRLCADSPTPFYHQLTRHPIKLLSTPPLPPPKISTTLISPSHLRNADVLTVVLVALEVEATSLRISSLNYVLARSTDACGRKWTRDFSVYKIVKHPRLLWSYVTNKSLPFGLVYHECGHFTISWGCQFTSWLLFGVRY